MATEKVTPMLLNVDLQCPCCYKKIKKTLCKFPQIRDQVFDEKANQVAITVVCCSPEKIRDKLCCKGGKAIKSIKIIEPEKKPEKPKEPEKPKAADKPKEPEKPKEKPKEPEKPKEKPKEPEKPKEAEKPKAADGGAPPAEKPKGPPPAEKPKEAPKPGPAKIAEPAAMPPAALQVMGPGPALVHGVPSVFPYNGPSHDAYGAGPYYRGYGFPPPPQPLCEGYYGHGHGHSYGYGGVAHGHGNRCDNYFSEENPQTCTIM
ncbi:hypothetical protein C2S51_015761 [Perilla frutescens var. frutescens]|nr:hypothetical protein C2S51_015761 [Perilla frutescens var. frutescens]